jgi:hypothetical protein
MNPATGIGPRQVVGWKRLTDNRLGVLGMFMTAFFWPGLVHRHSGLSPWVHGVFGRVLQAQRKQLPREIFAADLVVAFIA